MLEVNVAIYVVTLAEDFRALLTLQRNDFCIAYMYFCMVRGYKSWFFSCTSIASLSTF